MPVNYGQLSQIVAPSGAIAQASAPSAPSLPVQGNPLDSLSGGIMSGILQGQQMKGNDLNMKNTQAEMDRRAALLPGELENQKTVNQGNNLDNQNKQWDLKDKEQAHVAARQLREAAAKGEKSYLDYLNSTKPDAAQKYLLTKAQTNAAIADEASKYAEADSKKASAAKTNEETAGLQLDNAGKITHEAAVAMSYVSGIKDPQKRDQEYKRMLPTLSPRAQKILSPTYDEAQAAGLMNQDKVNYAAAIDNLHQETDAKKPKELSDVEKKVEALSKYRSALEAAPEGSPEQAKAQAQYDDAVSLLKQDKSIPQQILDKVLGNKVTKPRTTTDAAVIPEGRVSVVGPDGKAYHLPKAQLDEAIKQGYKVQGQ